MREATMSRLSGVNEVPRPVSRLMCPWRAASKRWPEVHDAVAGFPLPLYSMVNGEGSMPHTGQVKAHENPCES